jgi:hypothetical protein
MSSSCNVGVVVPPMSNAVKSDGDESEIAANAGPDPVATANPTPSATANAPARLMSIVVLIAHPLVVSGSPQIVAPARSDQTSSAPAQIRLGYPRSCLAVARLTQDVI